MSNDQPPRTQSPGPGTSRKDRAMSNTAHTTNRSIDPAVIEAAIQRGRRERSRAFWAMLQSIFGRPEDRGSSVAPPAADPTAAALR